MRYFLLKNYDNLIISLDSCGFINSVHDGSFPSICKENKKLDRIVFDYNHNQLNGREIDNFIDYVRHHDPVESEDSDNLVYMRELIC